MRVGQPDEAGVAAGGHAAGDFEGQHIDYVHVKTAEGVIELAAAIGL